jgi:hypothetical protein
MAVPGSSLWLRNSHACEYINVLANVLVEKHGA